MKYLVMRENQDGQPCLEDLRSRLVWPHIVAGDDVVDAQAVAGNREREIGPVDIRDDADRYSGLGEIVQEGPCVGKDRWLDSVIELELEERIRIENGTNVGERLHQ